jgi:hypothetical protein
VERTVTPKFDPRPYWRVVEDCLVELHGLSRTEARRSVSELRARLKALPPGIDRDIIYHEEPVHVAADLVGRNLPHETYRQPYDQILERHYPSLRTGYVAQSTSA